MHVHALYLIFNVLSHQYQIVSDKNNSIKILMTQIININESVYDAHFNNWQDFNFISNLLNTVAVDIH